ncbi:MAG: hypothetical protein JWL94_332 [Microbacteriaceae bacterium]|nr:hypothetical protein [Microbacteriaceae bacterium]
MLLVVEIVTILVEVVFLIVIDWMLGASFMLCWIPLWIYGYGYGYGFEK